ncbi:MAG: GH25 family lysozyme, partial [Rhizobiaceae bacterium]|nr:GH25 family lysozyme [Rhizobiaceae bacterium]
MNRTVKRSIIGAVILVAASAFYFAYDFGMFRFRAPSLEDYPIQGIDVSHHQGDIDWHKLAAQPKVRFAIIKSTEGGDFRDGKFDENWRRAGEAGIVRGAYHFFTFCRAGKEQALNVLATVPREPGT